MGTFSTELRAAIIRRRREQMVDFSEERVFHANMMQLYHSMRASENFLGIAAAMCSDAVVKAYYERHLLEEQGHAEWMGQDLLEAGIPMDVIPRNAVTMAGTQYYMIFHVSPMCLLGYMAAMECTPPTMDLIKALEILYGKTALRTLRLHAEKDPEHAVELLRVIDTLPEHYHGFVMEAAMQVCHYMGQPLVMMEPQNG